LKGETAGVGQVAAFDAGHGHFVALLQSLGSFAGQGVAALAGL